MHGPNWVRAACCSTIWWSLIDVVFTINLPASGVPQRSFFSVPAELLALAVGPWNVTRQSSCWLNLCWLSKISWVMANYWRKPAPWLRCMSALTKFKRASFSTPGQLVHASFAT